MINELRAYSMHMPAEVISNSINLNLFRPLKNRLALKKKYDIRKKAVLIFGRIAVEKNLDFALDIFADVLQQADAELIVVGEGPYKYTLEQKVREKRITQAVHFFGLLRDESLVEAMNAADVYLITSTSETQSMTTIQAMACGLPVVGANAGGLPEYIQDNKTGFIVNPGKKLVFVKKIIHLLTDENLAQKFGDAGRHSVMAFSPEQITKKFEIIYNKAKKINYIDKI